MTDSRTRRSRIVVNNPSTMAERQAEAERVAHSEAGEQAFNVQVESTGVAIGIGPMMRWPITYQVR